MVESRDRSLMPIRIYLTVGLKKSGSRGQFRSARSQFRSSAFIRQSSNSSLGRRIWAATETNEFGEERTQYGSARANRTGPISSTGIKRPVKSMQKMLSHPTLPNTRKNHQGA